MPATAHRKRGTSPRVRIVVYAWQDLTSMPAVNQSWMYPVSSVKMNGDTFANSIESYRYDPQYDPSIEYNVDHRCTRFRGYFGLSDDSEADGRATVVASADGQAWYDHTFGLGEYESGPAAWTTPPLKIRFESTSQNPDAMGLGAVGTPQVYCTR
jgi:hypothetical protein